MMPADADRLSQAIAAFHRRMVAAATHEFQNHLAVIKEYSGLAGDLLRSKPDDAGTAARSAGIAMKINQRASAAARQVDLLNRFAHRADARTCTFRLNDAVEELSELLQRQARAGRVSLDAELDARLDSITGDPALLQYLLYSLAEPFLEEPAEGSSMTFSTHARRKGRYEIGITARGPWAEGAQIPDGSAGGLITACLTQLECTAKWQQPKTDSQRLILTFSPR